MCAGNTCDPCLLSEDICSVLFIILGKQRRISGNSWPLINPSCDGQGASRKIALGLGKLGGASDTTLVLPVTVHCGWSPSLPILLLTLLICPPQLFPPLLLLPSLFLWEPKKDRDYSVTLSKSFLPPWATQFICQEIWVRLMLDVEELLLNYPQM